MEMKRMGRLAWLIVLGMSTLGGRVGAHADTLTWNGGATKEGDFMAASSWSPEQTPQPGDTLVIQEEVTFKSATVWGVAARGRSASRTTILEGPSMLRVNLAPLEPALVCLEPILK